MDFRIAAADVEDVEVLKVAGLIAHVYGASGPDVKNAKLTALREIAGTELRISRKGDR
jgi:hypothetical protein